MMTSEQDKDIDDKRWAEINESRSDSRLWDLIKSDDSLTRTSMDKIYTRAFCLINLSYMLVDVQDWCLRDFCELVHHFGLTARQKTKQVFSSVNKDIKSAMYHINEIGRDKGSGTDTEAYINGNSDIIYDVCRMMIDRLGNKKDAIHLIAEIRKMQNKNQVFPELDKGRYEVNF